MTIENQVVLNPIIKIKLNLQFFYGIILTIHISLLKCNTLFAFYIYVNKLISLMALNKNIYPKSL